MVKNVQKPSRHGIKNGGAFIGDGAFIEEFTVNIFFRFKLYQLVDLWLSATLMP